MSETILLRANTTKSKNKSNKTKQPHENSQGKLKLCFGVRFIVNFLFLQTIFVFFCTIQTIENKNGKIKFIMIHRLESRLLTILIVMTKIWHAVSFFIVLLLAIKNKFITDLIKT